MLQQQDISETDLNSWLSLGGRAERNKENNAIPTKWTSYKVYCNAASPCSSISLRFISSLWFRLYTGCPCSYSNLCLADSTKTRPQNWRNKCLYWGVRWWRMWRVSDYNDNATIRNNHYVYMHSALHAFGTQFIQCTIRSNHYVYIHSVLRALDTYSV